MTTIRLFSVVGSFAEDKDAAAKLRREVILRTLDAGSEVEIDFESVTLTTQSFVHALISEALRRHGESVLERLAFRNCGDAVRGIVETVVQYVLETVEDEGQETVQAEQPALGGPAA
jgi:uncharacterized protein DUF4325